MKKLIILYLLTIFIGIPLVFTALLFFGSIAFILGVIALIGVFVSIGSKYI